MESSLERGFLSEYSVESLEAGGLLFYGILVDYCLIMVLSYLLWMLHSVLCGISVLYSRAQCTILQAVIQLPACSWQAPGECPDYLLSRVLCRNRPDRATNPVTCYQLTLTR